MLGLRSVVFPATLFALSTLTRGADVDDPIFYLDFNEFTNNTIVSQAAIPLAGSVIGATFMPTGYLAGAYSFDDIDDKIIFGPSGVFDLTNLTVTAWVRSPDYNDGFQTVVDSATTLLERGGITFVIVDNELRLTLRYGDGTYHQFRAQSSFSAADNGEWKFLVGTHEYDGMNATGKLYLDRELVLSETVPTPPPTYDFQNVYIGNNFVTAINRAFHGDIDELRIYNRVLDQSDIDAMYAVGPMMIFNARELTWFGRAGETYQLQRADAGTPMSWINDGGVVTGGNAEVSFFRSRTDPPSNYRIVHGP